MVKKIKFYIFSFIYCNFFQADDLAAEMQMARHQYYNRWTWHSRHADRQCFVRAQSATHRAETLPANDRELTTTITTRVMRCNETREERESHSMCRCLSSHWSNAVVWRAIQRLLRAPSTFLPVVYNDTTVVETIKHTGCTVKLLFGGVVGKRCHCVTRVFPILFRTEIDNLKKPPKHTFFPFLFVLLL